MAQELNTTATDDLIEDSSLATHEDVYEDVDDEFGYDDYRTLSVAAVGSVIIGVISMVAMLFPTLLIIPAVGTGLGLFAVWTVFARRDEFTGQRLAVVGLCLSAGMFVFGAVLHLYINRIEPPEGYIPVSFWELQPDKGIDLNQLMQLRRKNVPIPLPERARELNGQRVFLTGYVYPGAQRENLKRFVMVPDMKTCCFGGQPKLTDMIEVELKDPLRINQSLMKRGLGGTLIVHDTMQNRDQLKGVVFQLEADYLD